MKIGIDLGGSHIAIGVVDEEGKILEKTEKRLTSVEKENIKKSIEDTIIEQASQFKAQYEIEEIGMAIPGWAENGVMIETGNIGIKNYPIAQILQEKIGLPIKIRNDAKCAALAEYTYGCLKGYDRSLFLTLGTGIGGAVFYNNQLLEAGKRPGYEIGHMVIEKNGIQCTCGRKGCFERYASMKALKNNLRKSLGFDENVRGEQLLDMIRIFEPEVIGIGGSFVYFQDVLLPRLKEKIEPERAEIVLEAAVLGNDAGIIGATL